MLFPRSYFLEMLLLQIDLSEEVVSFLIKKTSQFSDSIFFDYWGDVTALTTPTGRPMKMIS